MVTCCKLLWKERKAFKANIVTMFQAEEARSFQGIFEVYSSTLNFGTTHSCFFNGTISLEVQWLLVWFFLHVILELPPDSNFTFLFLWKQLWKAYDCYRKWQALNLTILKKELNTSVKIK